MSNLEDPDGIEGCETRSLFEGDRSGPSRVLPIRGVPSGGRKCQFKLANGIYCSAVRDTDHECAP